MKAAGARSISQFVGQDQAQRGQPRRRWPRRVLALGGLALGGGLLGGFPLWAARKIIYPPGDHAPPNGQSPSVEIELESGARPEYVTFPARDGGRLGGWFVPGAERTEQPWACIVLAYGYAGHKEQMAFYAKIVHEGGFAALMFDMEGSGLRRGMPVTLGYKERWDLMDAVAYARSRPDVDAQRIGVLGVSMGAATALLAAEEDPHIKAIVADSSYARVSDMVQPGLRAFVGRPAAYFAPLIVWLAETMLGVKTDQITPERSAGLLGARPVLVIHGADDELTDPESAHRIYEAVRGEKDLWLVPDCGHARAPDVAYSEYTRRVNSFFLRALGPDEGRDGGRAGDEVV